MLDDKLLPGETNKRTNFQIIGIDIVIGGHS